VNVCVHSINESLPKLQPIMDTVPACGIISYNDVIDAGEPGIDKRPVHYLTAEGVFALDKPTVLSIPDFHVDVGSYIYSEDDSDYDSAEDDYVDDMPSTLLQTQIVAQSEVRNPAVDRQELRLQQGNHEWYTSQQAVLKTEIALLRRKIESSNTVMGRLDEAELKTRMRTLEHQLRRSEESSRDAEVRVKELQETLEQTEAEPDTAVEVLLDENVEEVSTSHIMPTVATESPTFEEAVQDNESLRGQIDGLQEQIEKLRARIAAKQANARQKESSREQETMKD